LHKEPTLLVEGDGITGVVSLPRKAKFGRRRESGEALGIEGPEVGAAAGLQAVRNPVPAFLTASLFPGEKLVHLKTVTVPLRRRPFLHGAAIVSVQQSKKGPPMKIKLPINHHVYVRQSLALATFLLLATGALAQTYTVTDLGTLGPNSLGNYSVAYSINGNGQIAGSSSSSVPNMTDPAFLYSNGQLINLGTLGGEYGQGRSINSSGQIAGYSTLANGSYRAFLYSNGQMVALGTLGADYSVGYALNDAGDVVGSSEQVGGQEHACLFTNGDVIDLGTLGGATSTAHGINNLGVIVGYAYTAAGDFLGFTYQNGTMTPIGTLGGSWSIAYAINDQNQIAGQAYTRGNRAAHAFRLSAGVMADLGTLGGSSSWGLRINSSGTVIGFSTTRSNVYHAFVSFDGGKMQDLNKLIPRRSGWVLGEADGINDAGQIVGYGTIHGQTHAFLLTPAQ
jgi:probable HAF family extracellular repeat protein